MNFLTKILFLALMLAILPSLPQHVHASSSLDGAYLYYIEVYISYEPGYEPIVYKGYLSVIVKDGEISSIRIEVSGNILGSYVPPLFEKAVNKWIEGLKFRVSVSRGSKTYMSIEDKIVVAYVVRGSNFVEYREARTGVYLGGFTRFPMSVVQHPYRAIYAGTVTVTVVSYIVVVEPPSITSQFELVEPPTNDIRLLGIVIVIGIVAGAALTIARWDNYNLDILMR